MHRLLLDQVGDLLDELGLVDLIGNLGHDDAVATRGALLDVRLGANRDGAAAGLVGLADAAATHDGRAGREIRAGDDLQQLIERDVRVLHDGDGRVDGLGEVMRRDVRRHADGDAGGAVDEQVGEARGEHLGLLHRLVVVGLPVDRLLLEVGEQLHGRLVEARFGVAHGRGGVAVDGTEVAVAVDERNAHGEVLREAHESVVDGGVAVRVILTHAVADGACRLDVRLVRRDAALVHRVEDAAMDGLEAIAHVGQCAGHDDGHRVLEERGAHLASEVGLGDLADVDVERADAVVDLGLEAFLDGLAGLLDVFDRGLHDLGELVVAHEGFLVIVVEGIVCHCSSLLRCRGSARRCRPHAR